MTRQILLAEIMHESNTFNHVPTTRRDFEARYYLVGDEIRDRLRGTNTEVWGFLEAGEAYGWDVVHPLAASASPSGPMTAEDWHEIKRIILAPLAAGRRFDAVILILHGAMVTQTTDDADGELLESVRELAGRDVLVVATLDMHANVSERMVANTDLMMAYRTYPHVDQCDLAKHAAAILERIMNEGLKTRQHFVRRPMMDAADHGQTTAGPMMDLLAKAAEIEGRAGVLSVSIQIGFPWADVRDMGASVIVTGLEAATQCRTYAEELADALWRTRHQTQLEFSRPEDVMPRAKQGAAGDRPLILADFADNPAGGAYGDSPNLLRHMLRAELKNAAFATIAHPAAVVEGIRVGEAGEIALSLGGCGRPDLTPPLEVRGEVIRLSDGGFVCEGPMWQGVRFSMGPTMVLRVDDIDIVVSSVPVAVMDLQVFRSVGIEPTSKTTIGLKSRNHFRAAYEPIAREVVLVDAGGIASMRLAELPYKNIPRPIWPLDMMEP
jgi:microcystin degradation protein MlrC